MTEKQFTFIAQLIDNHIQAQLSMSKMSQTTDIEKLKYATEITVAATALIELTLLYTNQQKAG